VVNFSFIWEGKMRRINIDDLKPDMILARSIYSSDGRILLNAGMVLNEQYIARLSDLGILSVYIVDEVFGIDHEVEDVVSERTRIETIQLVKDSFASLEQARKINVKMVQTLVGRLIDELLEHPQVLINLSDIRSYDDYTFAHSVNVCILSLMTGITLGYNDTKLKELGIGALLHDIGKVSLDKALINKPEDLSREEYELIKHHPQLGFEILRKYDDISLLSAHVAFQHHERWDGNGYPRGLAGEAIHEYARIVAVAVVYDALLADRPYRSSYSVNQAITILRRMAGVHLEKRCVDAFVVNIAIYPIGSIVELNSGVIGVVVDVNREMPNRPVVKVVYDKLTRRFYQAHEVDLSKLETVLITRILEEREIAQLLNRNTPDSS